MAETDFLKNRVSVKHKGDEFVFAVPSLVDDIKVGGRARDIRRSILGNADEDGLSGDVVVAVRAMATMEVLLIESSADWIYTPGKDGKPVVDSQKFPKDKVADIFQIYGDYTEQVTSFRFPGDTDNQSVGEEAVARQPDRGDNPV